MEIALGRLEGVDKVEISVQKQVFAVTYSPESSFQPQDLRTAVATANVRVLRFHVSADGEVQRDGDKHFFVSGKDRFLLVDQPDDLPVATRLTVKGEVDDSTSPFELKLEEFKPLEE